MNINDFKDLTYVEKFNQFREEIKNKLPNETLISRISILWQESKNEAPNRKPKNMTNTVISLIDYKTLNTEDVKCFAGFINTLENRNFAASYFLNTLYELVSTSYNNKQQQRELIAELIDSVSNLPQVDTTKEDYELFSIISSLLVQENFELINSLRELFSSTDLMNVKDDLTKLTLLQTFFEKPRDGSTRNKTILDYLLKNGADPNLFEEDTDPPFILAAKSGQYDLIDKFRDSNVDLNLVDSQGHTAYYYMLRDNPYLYKKWLPDVSCFPKEIGIFLSKEELRVNNIDVNKTLSLLKDTWESCSSKDTIMLYQATAIFFQYGRRALLNDENIDLFIDVLKDVFSCRHSNELFFNTALNLSHKPEYMRSIHRILTELEKELDEAPIPLELCQSLFVEAIHHREYALADELHKLAPSIISQAVIKNANSWKETKESLFYHAVSDSNLESVTYLLEKGCLPLPDEPIYSTALARGLNQLVPIMQARGFPIHPEDATKMAMGACEKGGLQQINFLMEMGFDLSIPFPNGFLPIQEAQKNGHNELVNKLLTHYGIEQFQSLYAIYEKFLGPLFGISPDNFLNFIREEFERWDKTSNRHGYMFDKDMLQTLANQYEIFWNELGDHLDHFNDCFEKFPYKDGHVTFLKEQKDVYDQMLLKIPDMKEFPPKELWRFAIDHAKEQYGPYIFENEPGYLRAFFNGMALAISSSDKEKTADWYIALHAATVLYTTKPSINSPDNEWPPITTDYVKISTGIRPSPCGFSIKNLDRDPIGESDLKNERYPEEKKVWQYNEQKYTLSYSSDRDRLSKKLDEIMATYNRQADEAKIPGEKLLNALFTARELEINHFCRDANGRTSNLALISFILSEGLPMCLLPDPNVFDGNGPESLAYRYLEGCINFRNHGLESVYEKSDEVKSLESLDLSNHPDLGQLRNQLLSIVSGKGWHEIF